MNKSYVKAIGLGLLSVLSLKGFAGGGGTVTASFTATIVCVGTNTILNSTSTTTS